MQGCFNIQKINKCNSPYKQHEGEKAGPLKIRKQSTLQKKYPFVIKTSQQTRNRKKQSVKRHLEKSTNNILKSEGQCSPLCQEQGKEVHSYHFYSPLCLRASPEQIDTTKKRHADQKRSKTLFPDAMIWSTKKLLKLISEFSKVTDCKVNIQKPIVFLDTKTIKNMKF